MAKGLSAPMFPPGSSPPPPPGSSSAPVGKAPTLGRVTPRFRAPKIILNAVEGFGKTSCAAYAPEPAIFQARDETGYETLLGVGLVPSVDSARIETWGDCLSLLDEMIAGSGQHKTIALDAIGGLERLCHEFVCARDFGNDWGERGFSSFQKGYDVSISEWLKLLHRLEALNGRGATILMLGHCRVKPFRNPMGADYDHYTSDMHDKTWGATAKWADAVLFGNFLTCVEQAKRDEGNVLKKGKGIGGDKRVIYTTRTDAYDAKNRYNMPGRIDLVDDHPEHNWGCIWNAIRKETTNGATQ